MKRLMAMVLPSRATEAWRDWRREAALPPAGRALAATDRRGMPAADMGPNAAIDAATAWLIRAQDRSGSADGGVARDFSLVHGWAASYPETTGYIVPTLLAVARLTGRDDLKVRARRMLDWLVSIQLVDGGFQGGRVDQTPVRSVTFNTGQVLIGLASGVREFGDQAYVAAMHRAARFLRDSQDADGAWRRHPTPFAEPGDKAYETHAAWGLFEAGYITPDEGYGEAGLRQVRWALMHQQPNGWFAKNCLERPRTPLTHTIGYVLRGVVEAHRFSNEPEFLDAALRTADSLTQCIRRDGWIAGRLDANWQPAANYACLTGIVQIAACWFLLADLVARPSFRSLACLANSFVRRTMYEPGRDVVDDIAGGVKGSHPIGGEYGPFEYLNWASKFCIDANMMELGWRPDRA